MNVRSFLDTNTLVYLLEGAVVPPAVAKPSAVVEANRKADITLALLANPDVVVGVQTFNELCNVSARKKIDWLKTSGMLDTLEALCADVVPLTLAVHKRGRALHVRYRFHIYDALMLAAALESGCTTFYSEDMQDGQVIDNVMTIRNPFRPRPP